MIGPKYYLPGRQILPSRKDCMAWHLTRHSCGFKHSSNAHTHLLVRYILYSTELSLVEFSQDSIPNAIDKVPCKYINYSASV